MRLYVDDTRKAPHGWKLAKTLDEAKHWLAGGQVTEISLDYDLGATEEQIAAGDMRGHSPDGNGHDLVLWMVANDILPHRINIHSHNHRGAKRMANYLMREARKAPTVKRAPRQELLDNGA